MDINYQSSRDTRVLFGDAKMSKVLGLGKVIISPDSSIEKVLLAETYAFNLLSVRQLAKMGLCTFFDVDVVTLMWRKSLKVAFAGHVETVCMSWTFHETPPKP